MILSDRDIKKALASGRIVITPVIDPKTQMGSCSVDLRLGKQFRIFNHSKFAYIDPNNPKLATDMMAEVKLKNGEPFILQPGDFVLATTMEKVTLPDDLVGHYGKGDITR